MIFSLQQQQQFFTQMLREQQSPGSLSHIEDRRLKVYQDLFFNNIESLLANGFPVIKSILGEKRWRELISDFWKQHRCQTPYFPRIGGELVDWLNHAKISILYDFPFLPELAHYELMEVVVDTADQSWPDLKGTLEDLRDETTLVLNPISVLLHYEYPVHQISKAFTPQDPGVEKTHLLIYRQQDHQVKFMQLSAASVILVDLLQTQARTLQDLVCSIEGSLNAPSGSLSTFIKQQVQDFVTRQVILI